MAHLASSESREISGVHARLVGACVEKWVGSQTPMSSLISMFDGLLLVISKIDVLLMHPSVRVHGNLQLRVPEVNEHSSRHKILKRLRHQVDSACQLADLADIGPAANADERTALNTIHSELTQLLDDISSSHSPMRSATESD